MIPIGGGEIGDLYTRWPSAALMYWNNRTRSIDTFQGEVQGLDDENGTLEQVYGIARRATQTEVIEITDCGHSPHRDQAQELIRIATFFMHNVAVADAKALQCLC